MYFLKWIFQSLNAELIKLQVPCKLVTLNCKNGSTNFWKSRLFKEILKDFKMLFQRHFLM